MPLLADVVLRVQSKFTGPLHAARSEKSLDRMQEGLGHLSGSEGRAGQFISYYCNSGCSKRWLRGFEGMHKCALKQAVITPPRTINIY